MSERHRRKKEPDAIRQRLIEHGADICGDVGVAGLSLQAVAERAGVTKGGLMHHFATKQALLEAIFDELLASLSRDVDARMEADVEPHGRFVRAYLQATLATFDTVTHRRWSAILVVSLTDVSLKARWASWMSTRLAAAGEEANEPMQAVARYAADGLWLGAVQGEPPPRSLVDGRLAEALVALTMPPTPAVANVSAPTSGRRGSPSRRRR